MATNETLAGITTLRIGVQHDASVGAELHAARFLGRQVNVHIDVGYVQHGENLAAGWQHLADVGNAVLNPAVARRDQRVVRNIDGVELHVVRSRVKRVLGLDFPRLRGTQRRPGAIQLLLALIQDFLRLKAFLSKRDGAGGRTPAGPATPGC